MPDRKYQIYFIIYDWIRIFLRVNPGSAFDEGGPATLALYKLCSPPNEPFSGLNITLINTRFAFTQFV